MMSRPVMLHGDSQTYDWLSENNRSPLTGVPLSNKTFSRNFALQAAIERFESAKRAHLASISAEEQKSEMISNEHHELHNFLSSIGLNEYFNNFMDNGFKFITD